MSYVPAAGRWARTAWTATEGAGGLLGARQGLAEGASVVLVATGSGRGNRLRCTGGVAEARICTSDPRLGGGSGSQMYKWQGEVYI